MGFDLYSTGKHKNSKGEYFRNNVWWWRRLADFVFNYTKVVDEEDRDKWHFNDNHEVTKDEAEQIAKQLRHAIEHGVVDAYERKVKEEMEKADKYNTRVQRLHDKLREKVIKDTQASSDIAPIDYPQPYKDKWDKIQSMYNYNANYPFSKSNVEEFIQFCENSNGFTIG